MLVKLSLTKAWLDHEQIIKFVLIFLKDIHSSDFIVELVQSASAYIELSCIIWKAHSVRMCASFLLCKISLSCHLCFNVGDSVSSSLDIALIKSCAVIIIHLYCMSCAHFFSLKVYQSNNLQFSDQRFSNIWDVIFAHDLQISCWVCEFISDLKACVSDH